MTPELKTGRITAMLILAQIAGGTFVNFVLLPAVFSAPGGYLANAAAHATDFSIAALLGIALGTIMMGIAIALWPILRKHSETMALWLLALGIGGFALAAVEQTTTLSLLSLSQAYAKAGADAASFEIARGIVASARNWAHYVNLIVAGVTFLVFYTALFRFTLVPRVLAAFGILAALSQMTAISMPFFGHEVIFPMLAPLGLCQLALAIWLLVKGFGDTTPTQPG
jgi:hypothetical protein